MPHNVDPSPLLLKLDLLLLCSMKRIPFSRSTRWISRFMCPRAGPISFVLLEGHLCLMLYGTGSKLISDALRGGSLCDFLVTYDLSSPRSPDSLLEVSPLEALTTNSRWLVAQLVPLSRDLTLASFVGSRMSLHFPRDCSLSS